METPAQPRPGRFPGFSGGIVKGLALLSALALVASAQQAPAGAQDNSGIATTFEDGGLDGWTSRVGCKLANTAADAHGGSHSLLVTGRTADYDGPQIGVSNKMYSGSDYSISVWVKLAPSATESDTLRVTLQVTLAGTTNYYSVVPNTPVPLGTWVNLSVPTYSMVYAYDPGKAYLYVESNSGTQSFYIDDFQLAYWSWSPSWTPLRDAAAQRALLVGTAADYSLINQEPYAAAMGREYSVLEPENDMKWATIHPNPPGSASEYNFVPGDGLVAFAQVHGMQVRGHNLCWQADNPAWLANGNYTAAQLYQILHDHITTVVSHYKGQVFAWDVVNEALDDITYTPRNSIWFNQPGIGLSGTGYIAQAFQWAHAADPGAVLFYNDYNVEDASSPKSTAMYNMVKAFLAQGVPIGGVGLQCHITKDASSLSSAGLDANIARLTALGLQVHITELDVRVPVDQNGAASSADLQAQAQRYHDIAAVCLKYPGCTLLQTWGFTDSHSWIPSYYPGYGAALPFDSSYQPKPAFTSIEQLFATAPPVLSVSGLDNAASYQAGVVAPGELLAIFGTKFGPGSLAMGQYDANGRLASSLAGVQVLFDGVPAPIVFALASQTAVLAPFEIAGKSSTTITYSYQSIPSNAVTLPVALAVPGLFASNSQGFGQGAILNQDYSVNSVGNPVLPGGIVQLFGTGGGAFTTNVPDGELIGVPLPALQAQVTATVGGLPAKILYAGPAPTLVAGVLQVDLEIPQGLTGPQPVVLTVAGVTTQSNLTVAVK